MAINKVGSKGIEDGSVATVDLAPGSVTNAKLTNSSFTFDGTSISLGGSDSVNLSANWQSVITADGSTGTTAVAGNGYFIDTTSATHTITLPSSASIGDLVAIKDYAGTFATNNLTIARNGHNIQGVANDSLITTNRASLVLVYVDSTKGWLYWEEHNVADLQAATFITATGGTITTSGDYKIHTFTGDGCFVVSCGGNPVGSDSVDYLVVAGGGGGGPSTGGGGGGGGGVRVSSGAASGCYTASPLAACVSGITVTATTYPITVGGGGAGAVSYNSPTGGATVTGSNGSNSVFSTITSTGGGQGGAYQSPIPNRAGGSGGGGAGNGCGPGGVPGPGGAGNTPPVSPSQGNNGGAGSPGTGGFCAGGGGGGATVVGSNAPRNGDAGPGGTGATSCISASPVGYSGGGGGGLRTQGPTPAGPVIPGGASPCGSGGAGGTGSIGAGSNGSANRGGGGGGGNITFPSPGADSSGGAGGKGIVIIRYKFQ